MTTAYPGANDVFGVPTLPEATPLSEAGTSTRNHTEHHADLGAAVEAIEANASQIPHAHGGDNDDPLSGVQLLQANTHQSPDTDVAITSLHHSIDPTGASATKAAAANHTHDWISVPETIRHRPLIICTSTTRPSSPFLGQQILETDTGCYRVWFAFVAGASPFWQLLPTGSTPILHAETHSFQTIHFGDFETDCHWDHIREDDWGFFDWFEDLLEDWFHPHHGRDVDITPVTDMVIPETGHYDVHAAIHWHPDHSWMDHSSISVSVNGLDIRRRNWEFVRGFTFAPGFSQTNEMNFHWYFQKGDILRVRAKHNADRDCWLWWFDDDDDHKSQTNTVEVRFTGV